MSLKKEILNLLLENEGCSVSGQLMASKFNVTRGAIWKAIKSLKSEGYKISGVNNLGYAINAISNNYSKSYLKKYLKEKFKIEIFEEIDSTSSYLKRITNKTTLPHLVCACSQSNGKGRTGKNFYSPKNGLYFSFKVKVNENIDLELLTIKVAVAVLKSLKQITNRNCQVKWVNDIYYHGKKVSGILCEATIDPISGNYENVIVGIGINLSKIKFPNELNNIATSLNVSECNVNLLIASIINETLYGDCSNEQILSYYKEKCLLLNKEVNFKINEKEYSGLAIDINENGNLVVSVDDQIMVLSSGEVSLVVKNMNELNNLTNKQKSIIQIMARVAMYTTLLIISKFIAIPMPLGDYLTLQLEVVIMIGLISNGKISFYSTLLYVFMGLIGIPVFASGGGFDYILRPSFGYIYGFIIAATVIGYLSNKFSKFTLLRSVLLSLLGIFIIYLCGYVHKYVIYNFYLGETLYLKEIILATFTFEIPKDLFLGVLTGIAGFKLKNIIKRVYVI